MKTILSGKMMKNGSYIQGECVMLDTNGNCYECIDSKYHPNPGTAKDGYSEIERTVDWLYLHDIKAVKSLLNQWVAIRVAYELEDDPMLSLNDVVVNVFYSDWYEPCAESLSAVERAYQACQNAGNRNRYIQGSMTELEVAGKIASYLNEHFLRVRAGGKLDSQGTDTIYFRISSHGYDWRTVIMEFLWDVFGTVENMPRLIWIGHDAETNPPEITLYEGSPEELIDMYDSAVFASDDIVWL